MGALNDWRSRPRKPRPDLVVRNRSNATHAMTGSPTWKSWDAMKQRILNHSSKDYANYGGRGLDIDPRWLMFAAFFEDMGVKPSDCTLGRINNNLGYWPDNCRWETSEQQNNNRRSSRFVTIDGETRSIAQWARYLGVSRQTFRHRVQVGWPEAILLCTINHWNRTEKLCRYELPKQLNLFM